jgi:hypothetical protein
MITCAAETLLKKASFVSLSKCICAAARIADLSSVFYSAKVKQGGLDRLKSYFEDYHTAYEKIR